MTGGLPFGIEHALGVDVGTTTGSSVMTSVTPSGTVNTKGSWAQLVAATTIDAAMVLYSFSGGINNPGGGYLVDFGVGPAGQEKVIIQNVPVGFLGDSYAGVPHGFIPLQIQKGQRLAARCQSNVGSDIAITAGLMLFDGSLAQMEGAAGADNLGASIATSLGVPMVAGSTNTKGSYVVLSAATARDYMGFIIHYGRNSGSGSTKYNSLVDIAVGPSGTERIIVSNLYELIINGSISHPQAVGPFYIPIQAGQRVAARHQCSTASLQSNISLVAFYA